MTKSKYDVATTFIYINGMDWGSWFHPSFVSTSNIRLILHNFRFEEMIISGTKINLCENRVGSV